MKRISDSFHGTTFPKMKGIQFYLRDDSKHVITEYVHGKESERGSDESKHRFRERSVDDCLHFEFIGFQKCLS